MVVAGVVGEEGDGECESRLVVALPTCSCVAVCVRHGAGRCRGWSECADRDERQYRNGGLVLTLIVCELRAVSRVGIFNRRERWKQTPIDIPLSGVMTFFFAPIYFQYHLFDYSVEGKVG